MRKIASNYLWTPQGLIPQPLVEVDVDGRVSSVKQYDTIDGCQGVEFYAGIMTPAFINTHCHLELSYMKNAIAEGCGFTGFASSIGSLRGQFSDQERANAISAADTKMWSDGIQAVGDVSNGSTSFDVKSRSKIKYHTFVEFFGLRNNNMEVCAELLQYPNTSLTPHSTYSVQDTPFREICTEGDAPLSIHFLESASEKELFLRYGEMWDWYLKMGFECDFLQYGMPAERIIESIPKDRSVILVHNCHLSQLDIDLIMTHFTVPVYWCLCPRSNSYISGIQPPVELLRNNSLNICLGTDSLASNHTLSIFEEMRALGNIPVTELIGWATRGGAKALGITDLGEVKAGNICGLNILSGLDYERMVITEHSKIQRII